MDADVALMEVNCR